MPAPMKKISLFIIAIILCWMAYFLFQPVSPQSTVNTASTGVSKVEQSAGPTAVPSPVPPQAEAVTKNSATVLPQAAAPAQTAEQIKSDFRKIVAFNDWAETYVAADKETQKAMKQDGIRLATERRPLFKQLIVRDPQRALEQAVRRVVRQELPEEIVEQLERPISANGEYKVYQGRPLPGAVLPADTELTMRYFDTENGESLKARVFGKMEPVISKAKIPLRGVALDREFAVAESPVRKLEVGERIAKGSVVDSTCPVSGRTTQEVIEENQPVTEETPVVEVGGTLITLCNGSHVTVLEETYLQASGAGGAGNFKDNYPGTSATAIGNLRCLYIRVTYPDQLKAPNTETSAYSDMRNVSRYYLESSFGRMTETATVTPLIVLPHTQAWYIAKDSEVDGLGLVHSDSRSEAKKLGYDNAQYNCTIVRVNGGPRLSGISWGGGSSVWVTWDGMDVLNHECGHSLGRNHANYWSTSDGTAIGNGANQEYGNSFDVMGGGGGFGAHYNTISKRALGWLSDPYVARPVATPTANGVYRIVAYDQPSLEDGKLYCLRVTKDSARDYYIEYHPAIGGQLADEAMVLFKWSGMSNAGHLLDTTPGSGAGKSDGGIQIGRTFSDMEANLHFTVVSKNATVPPSLDVALQRGPFPGNLPPTVSLSASNTTAAVGSNITFTATASDPNGDALSYHWDFNDGVASQNTAVLTRNFPATDQMTVMVTVSDMKGGSARAHVVVNIGSPGRAVVTGQITDAGQPVMGVLVTSENGKYCYTDSSGNYALSDLTLAAHTLSATLAGYTFTNTFTNPITPTAGTNTGNWTAGSIPQLTMAATADATEGGASGTFVFTRTGDTTAALDFHIAAPSGNATVTTDYTFSPAYVDDGLFKKFTFPAGSATLTVNVVPVNDTGAEGPETVDIQFAAGAGYLVTNSGTSSVVIADNDTTLPQVKLTMPDTMATEAPGDAANFILTRSGSTGLPLNVVLTYTGTSTKGTDYPNLATTLTIPAGQSSLNVPVAPIDDSSLELAEDFIVTVATNGAYVIDAANKTATATIIDDETPVVTVSALDPSASEAGRDPGIVLISRTGSTAAALKVYYGLSGSALHGTDYVELPGEVTIPAGMSSVPVMITPYDDAHGESTESVTFNLTTFNGAYGLGPAYSASVSITDNNDPPVVSVGGGTTAAEPSTNGTFVIRSKGSNSAPITVHYTVSGTATSGVDFTARTGVVTFPGDGSADATISIPVLDDALAEDVETVVLTVTPDPAYVLYNDSSAIIRIKDDEQPFVSVSTHSTTPAEPSTASSFYLSRSNSTGDLVVNYTMSGTAVNGADYQLLSGSATIADGQTGVDVTITPTDDTTIEGIESIVLTINADAAYGTEVSSGTLYLTDNETPSVSVAFNASTSTTTEALDPTLGEFRDIPVVISAVQTAPVTVEYTAAGGSAAGDDVDWAFVDATNGNAIIPRGKLTFPAGVTTQNIRIKIKNDTVQEGAETAVITLRNVLGQAVRISTSKPTHTLTINDANNLTPRVQFLLASSTVVEADGKEPLLMAVLDKPATTAVTVNYTATGTASSPADYSLPAGTLTFAIGETFKPLPLTIVADAIPELAETIVVTLSNPVGADIGTTTVHTITVKETNTPELAITASTPDAIEGGQAGAFTISRSGGSTALALTVTYAISGTATNVSDYAALGGSVVLPAGQTSVSIQVAPTDDTTTEADETVIITLQPDLNYTLGTTTDATVTILDNDAPPTITLVSPTVTDVSIPNNVGLILEAESSRTTPTGVSQVPIVWSMVNGPGAVTFDDANANRTGATFSSTGTYVLRASSGQSNGITTLDINVFYNAPALIGQDIGAVSGTTTAGSHTINGGTITVKASGLGLSASGTTDGFYFLYVPVTGNFDIKCRVASLANPGGETSCRWGLMARASTAANAQYAMSFYRDSKVHGYQYRATAGAVPGSSVGTTVYTMPRWLRLTRTGDVFAAYHSADGLTWAQRGTNQTIAMGATPLVGFALTSAIQASLSTAVFDNSTVPVSANNGPFVNAGSDLSGVAPWNLDATITDDGFPLPASLTHVWSTLSGPNSATFGSASATDTSVTFPSTGIYKLRLTASDGAVTTFDDTTANVTVPLPVDLWRVAKFGANSSNPIIAGDDSDPDHDGIKNLVEYGLGLDPNAPSNKLPSPSLDGPYLSLTYQKNLAATDVVLTVEESNDLIHWTPSEVTETVLSTTGQTQMIKATTSGTGQTQFLHLKVTLNPPEPLLD